MLPGKCRGRSRGFINSLSWNRKYGISSQLKPGIHIHRYDRQHNKGDKDIFPVQHHLGVGLGLMAAIR
jgi:hypothetical protein